jgi:hypothetical protein
MSDNNKRYPKATELEPRLDMPGGSVAAIADWLGVKHRTLYDWLTGAKPKGSNLNKVLDAIDEDSWPESAMRVQFCIYDAWHRATHPEEYGGPNGGKPCISDLL